MVHGVAEQSNGRFLLKSEKGKGHHCRDLAAVSTEATVRDQSPQTPAKAEHTLRILAVDDDPLVLFNTGAMLADLGHEVTEAGSGNAALRAFEAGAFDLVITDQAMRA